MGTKERKDCTNTRKHKYNLAFHTIKRKKCDRQAHLKMYFAIIIFNTIRCKLTILN